MNLHIQILAAEASADFRLLISATGARGENMATVASLNIDDPRLGEQLRNIAQAFRMGSRFGVES